MVAHRGPVGGVGLAVPMSMPRYTCMASTATISVPATAGAAAIATSDLPDAVGPSDDDRRGRPCQSAATGMRVRCVGSATTSTQLAR